MVLSLPIGPKIPSHNIFFINEDTVKNYVEQYLKIKDSKIFDGKTQSSDYNICRFWDNYLTVPARPCRAKIARET